jgi:hypothetical protein
MTNEKIKKIVENLLEELNKEETYLYRLFEKEGRIEEITFKRIK